MSFVNKEDIKNVEIDLHYQYEKSVDYLCGGKTKIDISPAHLTWRTILEEIKRKDSNVGNEDYAIEVRDENEQLHYKNLNDKVILDQTDFSKIYIRINAIFSLNIKTNLPIKNISDDNFDIDISNIRILEAKKYDNFETVKNEFKNQWLNYYNVGEELYNSAYFETTDEGEKIYIMEENLNKYKICGYGEVYLLLDEQMYGKFQHAPTVPITSLKELQATDVNQNTDIKRQAISCEYINLSHKGQLNCHVTSNIGESKEKIYLQYNKFNSMFLTWEEVAADARIMLELNIECYLIFNDRVLFPSNSVWDDLNRSASEFGVIKVELHENKEIPIKIITPIETIHKKVKSTATLNEINNELFSSPFVLKKKNSKFFCELKFGQIIICDLDCMINEIKQDEFHFNTIKNSHLMTIQVSINEKLYDVYADEQISVLLRKLELLSNFNENVPINALVKNNYIKLDDYSKSWSEVGF